MKAICVFTSRDSQNEFERFTDFIDRIKFLSSRSDDSKVDSVFIDAKVAQHILFYQLLNACNDLTKLNIDFRIFDSNVCLPLALTMQKPSVAKDNDIDAISNIKIARALFEEGNGRCEDTVILSPELIDEKWQIAGANDFSKSSNRVNPTLAEKTKPVAFFDDKYKYLPKGAIRFVTKLDLLNPKQAKLLLDNALLAIYKNYSPKTKDTDSEYEKLYMVWDGRIDKEAMRKNPGPTSNLMTNGLEDMMKSYFKYREYGKLLNIDLRNAQLLTNDKQKVIEAKTTFGSEGSQIKKYDQIKKSSKSGIVCKTLIAPFKAAPKTKLSKDEEYKSYGFKDLSTDNSNLRPLGIMPQMKLSEYKLKKRDKKIDKTLTRKIGDKKSPNMLFMDKERQAQFMLHDKNTLPAKPKKETPHAYRQVHSPQVGARELMERARLKSEKERLSRY